LGRGAKKVRSELRTIRATVRMTRRLKGSPESKYQPKRTGLTAVELGDLFQANPETIRKFARKRGLKIHPTNQSTENHPSAGADVGARSGGLIGGEDSPP